MLSSNYQHTWKVALDLRIPFKDLHLLHQSIMCFISDKDLIFLVETLVSKVKLYLIFFHSFIRSLKNYPNSREYVLYF
jgi:hypothetical protein